MTPVQQSLLDITPEDLASANDGRARASDPATSKAASRSVAPLTGKQRIAVLRALVQAGERGLVGEEAAVLCGIRYPHVATTRLGELESDEWGRLVERTDRTRRTSSGRSAIVFTATDAGRKMAETVRCSQ